MLDAATTAALCGLAGVAGLAAGATVAIRRQPDLTVTVDGDTLVVRLRGWDVLWAQRRTVRVPVAKVARVSVAVVDDEPDSGLPLWGTVVPGVIRVGTMAVEGGREFWDVRRGRHALQVECAEGAPLRRLLLEVPHAARRAHELRTLLARPVTVPAQGRREAGSPATTRS